MPFKTLMMVTPGMVKESPQNALHGYRAVFPEDKGSVTQK
jgi:hypothetical protein